MYNISENSYLFKIVNYLNGEDVDIQENVKTIANAELANTRELFESTLDQGVFLSQDYIRLRSFLVKWYAAHKVLTKIQDDAPKLFFLPEDHLEELMRSFGFPYGSALGSFREKINFFLSLIQIYTSKGSKGSIEQMLRFFNLPSTYILEHDLLYNEEGDLVFRPRLAINLPYSLRKTIDLRDATFESFTAGDPQWYLSKEEIDDLVSRNKITLPSRTNYFSFRTNFTYRSVEVVPLYFFGYMNKLYNEWKKDGSLPPQYIDVSILDFNVSILELYLATLYTLNKMFPEENNPASEDIRIYTGDKTYEEYEKGFNEQFKVPPYSREETEQLRTEWKEEFTTSSEDYAFTDKSVVEDTLEEINPTLKGIIDLWDEGSLQDNITLFAVKLAEWMRNNLDADLREISVYLFGFKAFQQLEISRIIDFFKPYRTKLNVSDLEYVLERPLFESIRYDDDLGESYINLYPEENLYLDEELMDTSIEQTYTEDTYVLNESTLTKIDLYNDENVYIDDEFGTIELDLLFVDPEIQFDVGYDFDARLINDNVYLTVQSEETYQESIYPGLIDTAVVNDNYYESIELKDTVQNDSVTILDENLNEKKVANQSVGHYYHFDKEGMNFDEPIIYDFASEFVNIYSEVVS